MTTAITAAADDVVERMLFREPGGGHLLATVAAGIRERRYAEGLADALGQPHPWRGWTSGELFQFALTYADTYGGHLGRVSIEVGNGPAPDRHRLQNAAALSDLPEPFAAHLSLDQHCDDMDGTLTWREPIRVSRSCTEDGEDSAEVSPTTLTVPLEVGYCNPSTVRFHLYSRGAVARWPYGSDRIWLLVGLPSPYAWYSNHGLGGIMNPLLGDALA